MVVRLGWSLDLSLSSVAVLRLVWDLWGIFLYMTSSFFLIDSMSFLFALAIMEEIALWQRERRSSSGGRLSSLSTSVAISDNGFFSETGMTWGLYDVGGSLLRLFTKFRSRVMRLICLVSDLLIGV
jgi:hypothetical protein